MFAGIPAALSSRGSTGLRTETASRFCAGRFTVQVFDQGEPGRRGGSIDGDDSPSSLPGAPTAVYTRAGYIEGGNIQVD